MAATPRCESSKLGPPLLRHLTQAEFDATVRVVFPPIANDGCRSCHQFFDPIGFAFEHFGPEGRYRPDEGGLLIDASGNIPLGVLEEQVEFEGLTDLGETLPSLPEVTDCVSGLTAAYVFGGAGGQSCLAEEASRPLKNPARRLTRLFRSWRRRQNFQYTWYSCVSAPTQERKILRDPPRRVFQRPARTSLAHGEIGMVEFIAQLAAAPHFRTRQ